MAHGLDAMVHLWSLAEGAIDELDEFGSEKGFFMAAAITPYDSEPEVIPDLAMYGELYF